MTFPRTRGEIADAEWRALRHQAEQVNCPPPPHGCAQPAGHTCQTSDGHQLVKLPAHAARIRTAERTTT